jgi:hypothetical protein
MAALKKVRKTTDHVQTARDESLDLPLQLPAGLRSKRSSTASRSSALAVRIRPTRQGGQNSRNTPPGTHKQTYRERIGGWRGDPPKNTLRPVRAAGDAHDGNQLISVSNSTDRKIPLFRVKKYATNPVGMTQCAETCPESERFGRPAALGGRGRNRLCCGAQGSGEDPTSNLA